MENERTHLDSALAILDRIQSEGESQFEMIAVGEVKRKKERRREEADGKARKGQSVVIF